MNGKIFGGRYNIEEKIGVGGTAEVYKAFDTTLDRTVAVKVLHERYAGEEDFVARFRREAKAAANLNQPNIVNIYDWGAENETYYLVMEYLVGRNLKEIINEQGALQPHLIVSIGRCVAAALQFAHKHQIVHRDIKPHNIVITDDGEVKVTDFGIARSSASNITQTGAILGTAHYLSPEQARGDEVGTASDLYSLGVVLFEMATGRVPFKSDSPVAVALKHIQEEPARPRDLNPDIPVKLERVILKAMAKKPGDRYSSGSELRDDLACSLEDSPAGSGLSEESDSDQTMILPKPGNVPRSPGGKGPRRKLRIAGLILVLALLFAGSAWATSFFLGQAATNVVPDLIGMTVKEARGQLAKNKLKHKVDDRVFDKSVPAGRIVEQTPEADKKLASGSMVSLTVSKGTEQVTVPDLSSRFLNEGMQELSRLGLDVGSIQRDYNDSVSDDYIISHEPAANARVAKGTAVKLLVSKGPRPLKVPYLIEKTANEARSSLSAMGLIMQQEEENDDEVEAGRIIRQDPAQGVSIEKGSTVIVWISSGPLLSTVPAVIGLSEKEAQTALEDKGFRVEIKDGISGKELYGKVVDQRPEEGASVRKGVTTTIWIGKKASAGD